MQSKATDPFLARVAVAFVLTGAAGSWALGYCALNPIVIGIFLIGWMVDIVLSTRHGDQEAVLGHALGFMLGMIYVTVLIQSTDIRDTFDTAPLVQEP